MDLTMKAGCTCDAFRHKFKEDGVTYRIKWLLKSLVMLQHYVGMLSPFSKSFHHHATETLLLILHERGQGPLTGHWVFSSNKSKLSHCTAIAQQRTIPAVWPCHSKQSCCSYGHFFGLKSCHLSHLIGSAAATGGRRAEAFLRRPPACALSPRGCSLRRTNASKPNLPGVSNYRNRPSRRLDSRRGKKRRLVHFEN